MATHGHISDARDVRVVVLHRRFPGPMDPRPASGGYLPTRLRPVKSRSNTATATESPGHPRCVDQTLVIIFLTDLICTRFEGFTHRLFTKTRAFPVSICRLSVQVRGVRG